jgi:hypothetical protein
MRELKILTKAENGMKSLLLFGLVLSSAGVVNPQISKPADSWAVVVPWHGGGTQQRNCYHDAFQLKPADLTQFSVILDMDKPGDSCIQYFYSASTTAANLANVQTQLQGQISTFKADVKKLSDLNDTLVQKLNQMEARLNKLEQSK